MTPPILPGEVWSGVATIPDLDDCDPGELPAVANIGVIVTVDEHGRAEAREAYAHRTEPLPSVEEERHAIGAALRALLALASAQAIADAWAEYHATEKACDAAGDALDRATAPKRGARAVWDAACQAHANAAA